jgi:hypothetical protein
VLFPGRQAIGTALRQADLCRSPVRSITPGDAIAYYRSETSKGVRTLGVVE